MARGEATRRHGARLLATAATAERAARAARMSRRALVGVGAALAIAGCGSRPHTEGNSSQAPARPEPRAILAALESALPRLPRPRSALPAPRDTASATAPAADTSAEESAAATIALDAACRRQEYVRLEHAPFVVYVPSAEAPALAPYLGPLLDHAAATLSTRYGVTLVPPLRIELYADRAAYVARLRGRVPFDVEGAYEHGAVIALSPAGGGRNWGQTLFHEVSHAYQDAATDAPLPRWVAEGLAELDARRERVEWRREYEGEFGDVLRDPGASLVADLERALRQPTSERELGDAYWLSTELVEFIEASHGRDAIRALVRTPDGAVPDDEARILAATGTSLRTLETTFRDARGPTLSSLADAHVPSLAGATEVETEAPNGVDGARPPEEPRAAVFALHAALALVDRRLDVARSEADRALELDPRHRLALYVRARVALLDEDLAAEGLLRRMVDVGDAYEARIALAGAALLRDDVAGAARDARAALALDPSSTEAWDLELRLAGRVAGIDRNASRRHLVDLDERASGLGLELVRDAAARSDWTTVRTYGERLLYVVPGRVELHAALARAYAALGDEAASRRERAIERATGPAARER